MNSKDVQEIIKLTEQSTSFILLAKNKEKIKSLCGGNFREEILERLWNTKPLSIEELE